MAREIRRLPAPYGLPVPPAPSGILQGHSGGNHDAGAHVVAERGRGPGIRPLRSGDGAPVFRPIGAHFRAGGRAQMAARGRRLRRHAFRSCRTPAGPLQRAHCDARSANRQAGHPLRQRRPPGRRLVPDGLVDGRGQVSARRALLGFLLAAAGALVARAEEPPGQDPCRVLREEPPGPRMTSYLRYQLDLAWRLDEERLRAWEGLRTEGDLAKLQETTRQKLLQMIGGLPQEKTDLHARFTGKIQMDGYSIEKL